MFLGTFEGLCFVDKKWSIDHGDIFFMYTDGLVEAMNSSREQYGYDRLVLQQGHHLKMILQY